MTAAKPTTQFTPTPQQVQQPQPSGEEPFIHPSLRGSPEAMAYAMGVRARQQGRFEKYTAERPVQPVAMPPLEQPHYPGMTMAQQATMYGQRPEERAAAAAGGESIVEAPRGARIGPVTPESLRGLNFEKLGLTMQDKLPEEALQDPQFQQGQGSMIAVNQPHLALKYGVIRGQQRIPPQAIQAALSGESQRRSMQDTIRDLGALAGAKPPTGVPTSDAEAEQQVADSAAGNSQNAGRPLSSEEKQQVEEAISKMDDFDYDGLRRQMEKDLLNNPDQRRIIEERLKPLSLTDLVMYDHVAQEIPIRPGEFWFELQNLTGDEDLALKRLIMQESRNLEVTERYLLDKYAFMSLTCGLVSINGKPVPYRHIDVDGNFDEKNFWLKLSWVLKRPLHMLASIGVNHTWFEMRVRKLFVAEKVKNG